MLTLLIIYKFYRKIISTKAAGYYIIIYINDYLFITGRTAGGKIVIESDDKMIANYPTDEVQKENDYERSGFKEIPVDHADKILFFLDNAGLEEIQKRIPEECYLMVIDKNLGMILSKEATKYKAVKKVLEKEGISIEDTYFFGDDNNDIELLKKAGYGVAVDNAHPDVKKAAR